MLVKNGSNFPWMAGQGIIKQNNSPHLIFQHHNMMVKNGMTRYNCDLVRRKDKVADCLWVPFLNQPWDSPIVHTKIYKVLK